MKNIIATEWIESNLFEKNVVHNIRAHLGKYRNIIVGTSGLNRM